jgi:hypothetical protein
MCLRMDSVHGSAPKTPARSGSSFMSTPSSPARSIRCRKYVGVQQIAVTPKSFISMICRSALPPDVGTTVAPSAFGAVVRAQAAGEEAVAIGVLHNVSAMQPAAGEAAHDHRGPYIHILLV